MKLFLDDERGPDFVYPGEPDWNLVTRPETVQRLMRVMPIEAVSLDHDLGEGVMTGYDLTCWIEEAVYHGVVRCPDWLGCHSANPTGRAKIEAAICAIRHRQGE